MFGSLLVKVKKNDILLRFNNKQQVIKVVKRLGDDFILKVSYRERAILDENHVKYEIIGYRGLIQYLFLLKHNISILIGIILFTSILYVNSLSIKQIEFNAETEDNVEIEAIINEHMTGKFNLYFLTTDLNELNFKLRKDFSDYEWIDVRKDGTVLKVTLLKPSVINKQIVVNEGYGDLVATKQGFIKSFQVEHGVVVVTKDQFVQKGQVLVSGNLCINREGWEPFYVRANGDVHALVHYTPTIQVPKKMTETQYTGKITTNKYLNLFGLDLKYRNNAIQYKDYDKKVTEEKLKIGKLELPLSTKKIHYYEKNDIIKVYDEKTAPFYALSLAKKQIIETFSDDDVIVETIMLKNEESADAFTYQYLIITDENIAEFQRRHVDEQ